MNPKDEEKVVVIEFNRHDQIDRIFMEPRGDAVKRFLSHNLGHFLLLHSEPNQEAKDIFNELLLLVKAGKWDEAFEKWQSLEISARSELPRPMEFYHLDQVPDLTEALAWLEHATLEEKT